MYFLQYNKQNQLNWKEIVISILLMLLLPSFIGLLFFIFNYYSKKNLTKSGYYAFFSCIAIYIGCINATKIPAGDQLAYATAYSNIPLVGFKGALLYIYGLGGNYSSTTEISGEFMNGIYNFIGYYITFGNYPLFICIYSYVELMLVFMGFYHFCQTIKDNHEPLIFGPLILAFFYLYFNMMIQIQKQFMAQAIMMYVIGNYARYGVMTRKLWIMSLVSLFTHASMILFFPFFVLKSMRKRISKLSFIFYSIIFASFIILGPSLVGNTFSDIESSDSAVSYSLKRVATSEKADDGLSIDFMHPRTLITLIPILYVLYNQFWKRRNLLTHSEIYILNLLFFLVLSTFAMYNQKVAQYRYYLMTYMFIPFVSTFLATNIRNRNNYMMILSFLSISSFYLFFEYIPWKYAPVSNIIFYPPISLIFSKL